MSITANKLLTALGTLIQPLENYAEQKLESFGAALEAGVGVIFQNFASDQQRIFTNVAAFWQARHGAAIEGGASELDAIEQATTAALNEFAAEEGAEFAQEKMAFITLLGSSARQALNRSPAPQP